jgi:hypothetical protein
MDDKKSVFEEMGVLNREPLCYHFNYMPASAHSWSRCLPQDRVDDLVSKTRHLSTATVLALLLLLACSTLDGRGPIGFEAEAAYGLSGIPVLNWMASLWYINPTLHPRFL